MKNTENKTNGLGMFAYTLKIIAIIAMLIDHIAWAFVPTGTILGQVMHTMGSLQHLLCLILYQKDFIIPIM